MRIIFFVHSIVSDWNNGNAHFLRGVATELVARGCDVVICEPVEGWSVAKLVKYHGAQTLRAFHEYFPDVHVTRYDSSTLDLDTTLDGADLVIVHEWNEPGLVRRIGAHRSLNTGYKLLFHDTHHRSVTDPAAMSAFDLKFYDGVLAFGEIVREIYLHRGWARAAWTWHEAADTRLFRPLDRIEPQGDLVWVGNWGDEERTAELREFIFDPARELRLNSRVYGVRYPSEAHQMLTDAGIEYAGWLANYRVPQVFSKFRVTVHVPRRPYVEKLRGIPTIRPFEALACGIPLVSSPWFDTEHIFTEGKDYLMARDGATMKDALRQILNDTALATSLSAHGHQTILSRHTCAHRVDELYGICRELGVAGAPQAARTSVRQQ